MSDTSSSLIATEVATEIMSNEAVAIDDDTGHGAGYIDPGQDGLNVPALNAQPLDAHRT